MIEVTEMERIAEKYDFIDVPDAPVKAEVANRAKRIALREFGELACKAVCRECKNGNPIVIFHGTEFHAHAPGGLCSASAIRKLMASEIEREGK